LQSASVLQVQKSLAQTEPYGLAVQFAALVHSTHRPEVVLQAGLAGSQVQSLSALQGDLQSLVVLL